MGELIELAGVRECNAFCIASILTCYIFVCLLYSPMSMLPILYIEWWVVIISTFHAVHTQPHGPLGDAFAIICVQCLDDCQFRDPILLAR